ncbi:MAG: hypothetical protein RL417_2021 [Pseudomonadota bacterium]|jgi:hypothetical protein
MSGDLSSKRRGSAKTLRRDDREASSKKITTDS